MTTQNPGPAVATSSNPVAQLTAPVPVNPQTGTAYTAVATDAPSSSMYQGVVTMNSASANLFTVPANASVPFPVGTQLVVTQLGAGQTTIAGASGVTVSTPSSLTARAQFSSLSLLQVSFNAWILGGDMT